MRHNDPSPTSVVKKIMVPDNHVANHYFIKFNSTLLEPKFDFTPAVKIKGVKPKDEFVVGNKTESLPSPDDSKK
jgi:hypothetical protein